MKQAISIFTVLLISINSFSQSTYSGFIGKYPIELVTDIQGDGYANAIYAYTNFDAPIVIRGTLKKNKLNLFEKDNKGNNKATLTFANFNIADKEMRGSWTDLKTGEQLKITLTKLFDIDYGDSIEWKDREILQPVSIADKYFKLVVSKSIGDFYAKVTGVKIHQKKTDSLIQRIDLECQLMGLNNIDVGDYNFDGITDFSVFEHSAAGPNTSSLYFLYNKKTARYINSGFQGTSLDFDSETKKIYEHNQCCAGNSHMYAEYKVVNNKMVLIKRTCLEYNEKKKDFVKIKCD
ncbi:MAG: XAC2610-related protein [Flavobacterium sp.]|uniref:XAC2610-related protein n=1 Tax=Flavobacterium sp. TaxID=239 RepID=UPI003BE15F86